jgi:integrase
MITKTKVDALKPGEVLWDSQVGGFCCRARKTTKTYSVFRSVNGRKQRFTIGRHGDITADQARKEAKRIVAELALGRDPAAHSASKNEMTVKDLGNLFLEQHVAGLKPNSRLDYERQLRLHILPALGKVPARALTRKDVLALHRKMRDTPPAANHVVRVLSAMYNFAKDNEYLNVDNPASRVKQYKEAKRETYLSQDQITRLWGVLDDFKHQRIADLVRLLLLTGCRKGELLNLEWSHVDLERGVLNLPDSKTGAKTIILSPDAEAIFSRLGRDNPDGYVWPGDNGSLAGNALTWHWERIRAQAGLDQVRLHDLRHSFASLAISAGVPLATVGGLMGHKDLKSTQRYAHLDDPALRAGAAVVGAAVNGIAKGKRK